LKACAAFAKISKVNESLSKQDQAGVGKKRYVFNPLILPLTVIRKRYNINKPTVGLLIKDAMPRIVKEDDYAARRNEILDVARKLVYTKGFEQMSIQDIMDALKISKGAFYHYFDSKQALLDGLIDRMLDEGERVLRPIVEAKDLSAIEKLRCYFDTAGRWKVAQKSFMLDLFRVWHADANAIMKSF